MTKLCVSGWGAFAACWAFAFWVSVAVWADDKPTKRVPPPGGRKADKMADKLAERVTAKQEAAAIFTPEREAAALVFVRREHPELEKLLAQLKPMRPAEYERAIIELFRTAESMVELAQRDPDRHQYALESWRLQSRADILTARLRNQPDDQKLKEDLRAVIAKQHELDVLREQQQIQRLRGNLARAEGNLRRLTEERDRLIEQRMRRLTNGWQPKPTKPKTGKNARPESPQAAPGADPPARPTAKTEFND